MPKIARYVVGGGLVGWSEMIEGFAPTPKSPWITLGQAVHWVHFHYSDAEDEQHYFSAGPGHDVPVGYLGQESLVFPGDPTPIEEVEWRNTYNRLRAALIAGTLSAWGENNAGESKEIAPVDWERLNILRYDMMPAYTPFKCIRVRRDDITQLWPPHQPSGCASSSRKGGRPSEIDWQDVRSQAESLVAAQPDISLGSMAASIAADLPLSKSGKQRDARGIEKRLKTWGFGPPT